MPPLDFPLPWTRRAPAPLILAPRVVVRPVRPADATALATFFRELSPRSRTRRFHGGMGELPPALLEQFTRAADAHGAALVAVRERRADGGEEIVGEARYVIEDGRDAEFALAVADTVQGCGVGRRLLRRLVRLAARAAVRRVYGEVQYDNKPMFRLAETLGFSQRRGAGDPWLRVVERVL
jgi:acetyltransferase